MTFSEIRKLNENNYKYITALNLIAIDLIHDGEILSDKRIGKDKTELAVRSDNILYLLRMCGNTCTTITWEVME